jgi:hypothetical protein
VTASNAESERATAPVAIGSVVWFFDENRRVYPEDENGKVKFGSPPIWREHWVKRYVVGETSRSWIIGLSAMKSDPRYGQKCPKADIGKRYALSEAEIDARAYCEEHSYQISLRVARLRTAADAEILRQIASLVGYVPKRPLP